MRSIVCAALMAMTAVLAAVAEETRDHLQGGSNVSIVSPAIVKELAPTGKLRAAINLGNMVLAQKDPTSGELARELARRLDLPLELITFDAAGKVFAALNEGAWDIAFLAIEPVRAAEIAFTAPYVIIEGVYLVANDSSLRTVADVDRDGMRIGVNKGSAYDLYLTRTLKHATLMRGESGIDLFRKQKLDAAAGVKQPLVEYAKSHPDVRVMDGRFMEIRQAMGTPKLRYAGRDAVPRYLHEFVEEMKASGFVAKALARSHQPDAVVAPLAE